jgi:hypothetical protein
MSQSMQAGNESGTSGSEVNEPSGAEPTKAPKPPLSVRLLRWRAPLALLSIVGIIGLMVAGVVEVVLNLVRRDMAFGRATRGLSSSVAVGWVVLMVVLICLCAFVKPVVRQARKLARFGAVVALVVVVYDLFLLVADLWGGATPSGIFLEVLGALLAIAVKMVMGLFLWRLARVVKPAPEADSLPDAPAGTSPAQSIWQTEEAMGTQWARPGMQTGGVNATAAGGAGQAQQMPLGQAISMAPGASAVVGDWRRGVQGVSTGFAGPHQAPWSTPATDVQRDLPAASAVQTDAPDQWPPAPRSGKTQSSEKMNGSKPQQSTADAVRVPGKGSPSSSHTAPTQPPKGPSLVKLTNPDDAASSADTGPVPFNVVAKDDLESPTTDSPAVDESAADQSDANK